jgi:IS1 family transposase
MFAGMVRHMTVEAAAIEAHNSQVRRDMARTRR